MKPHVTVITVLVNALALLSASGATSQQTVRLASPCQITGRHGIDRWPAKTDPERIPTDKSKITAIKPSQIFAWPGVGTKAGLTRNSKRLPSEQRWFALTGRVTGMKIEADGDIHIEMVDANDNRPGTVGAEISPGPIWCELRKLAFSWTTQKFPFSFGSSKTLTVTGRHVVTVTGKAFYDIDHAPKDRSNVRGKPFKPNYAVWEIHPVMGMTR
jgi:hypothetical protein